MPDPRLLPPNPAPCRTLSDPEWARIKNDDGWPSVAKTCIICGRKEDEEPRVFTARVLGDDWEEVDYLCDCVQQWILYHWFLNAGLKKDQQRYTWGQADGVEPEALAKAYDYAAKITDYANAGLGIILHSAATGTGKSLLASLILKKAMAEGVSRGFFTTFEQMVSAFTSGWRDEQAKVWFSDRVKNAGLLVIDDIGREYKGNMKLSEATVDLLLRHRISSGLPTIITTNLSQKEVEEGYGNNVFSLLAEVSFFVEVNSAADARKAARNQTLRDMQNGISQPLTVGWDL